MTPMSNELSVFSDLSNTLAPILAMVSKLLDYFVVGNELSVRGDLLAGSITDIARSIAEFSSYLPVLLGNYV
jgi:hypothetical protein